LEIYQRFFFILFPFFFLKKKTIIIKIFNQNSLKSASKAKQFLPRLTRQGRVGAVVEHVFNGSRLKIWVPRDNFKATFILTGSLPFFLSFFHFFFLLLIFFFFFLHE